VGRTHGNERADTVGNTRIAGVAGLGCRAPRHRVVGRPLPHRNASAKSSRR